ncbi:MAG: SGNH/GDSL hydrolase family protein [Acutalibacteraceae bacterium]|nr:SGNH/GDSL hydrolase family protein [Acutalibacteraceae bacterium]
MNNCFPLRFNLHKCGFGFAPDSETFARIYGETREFIEETLAQYEEVNTASANEIKVNTAEINLDFLKGKKIMLTGDSNTSDRLSWGKVLEKVLPCEVVDCAVSGWRSVQLLSEIDRMLYTYRPDIVVVQIGNNDSFFADKKQENLCVSKEEFERNLDCIAQKINGFGAKLIINSITPSYCEKINKDHQFWSATEENNQSFNDITEKVAYARGGLYHNFRGVFEKDMYDELFYPDGTHLMPLAHKKIAENFVRFLGESYENN